MKIGVLAVQGDFAEHLALLRKLGVDGQEVRLPEHLKGMDGLIIPGGESTTLGRLMSIYHLREPIEQMARQGKSIWGTCAGMIMMAHEITEEDPVPLQLMDIGVHRNAFGRQVDSFEQDLEIAGFDHVPFHGIFIRSPVINRVGRDVKVLAALSEDQPVAVRQGCMLATAFHPELTNDTRFHRLFLDLVSKESRPSA
ncbi:MAG: pyridoxal 5'-phosphate synthase glutaminase subunit PdxT [Chloroflexi bacterium]|nr:pyridoxal 5'-phosphate synthase glutaminase subunit PdxT [Chloroflexota bacterium]MCH8349854.1 pyridoxal 5'-phosphate synthase glutaminase subunit PdxT [Chloroflexota bacterium]MCI0780940.1 pyridoxal 5'-phosphate synthase glutaminase subunit PdxT [Chloroflexota bacterium]MCI0786362.1 pyridoxal 5'-phosphate synthase glutaminase subunit PdxT [Chloroflexota bacterium]MCI0793609.1 pyridoxal 5'-phosphate synthase glutaminase subunit PdxT [Chloroflexota bacterium]